MLLASRITPPSLLCILFWCERCYIPLYLICCYWATVVDLQSHSDWSLKSQVLTSAELEKYQYTGKFQVQAGRIGTKETSWKLPFAPSFDIKGFASSSMLVCCCRGCSSGRQIVSSGDVLMMNVYKQFREMEAVWQWVAYLRSVCSLSPHSLRFAMSSRLSTLARLSSVANSTFGTQSPQASFPIFALFL